MEIISSPFSVIKENGMVIRGRELHREDCGTCCAPVIICHGFTSDMSRTASDAEKFAEEGFRAFIFDFCGGGYRTVSDGSFEDYMTPFTEKEDLLAVIRAVCSRDDCDCENLTVMGCSQGGFVAALTAAEIPEQIRSLILFYPALCIPDDARNGQMQEMRFDPDDIPDHVGTSPMRVCREYVTSVRDIDTDSVLRAYHGPVLIVHGTDDRIVPYRYAVHAKEVLQDQAEFVTIKNGPHGFHEEPFFSEAISAALSFARRHAAMSHNETQDLPL